MIRLEGAEVLCDAFRSNSFLTNLDLSYNALGSHAACILGAALLENDMIRVLNLANNGIDSVGAMTMSVGMRENTSLREVNLDGNPVGEHGARALMKVVTQEGYRLHINTMNCDIVSKSSAVKLKLDNPVGEYILCMNHPYDRAVAYEALDIVANDANYELDVCEIYLAGENSTSSSTVVGKEGGLVENLRFGPKDLGSLVSNYVVYRFDEVKPIERIFAKETLEQTCMEVLATLQLLSFDRIESVIAKYDLMHTHTIDVSNLAALLHELLIHHQIDVNKSHYKAFYERFCRRVDADDNCLSGGSFVFLSQGSENIHIPSEFAASDGFSQQSDVNTSSTDQIDDKNAMEKLLQDFVDDCHRILDARSAGVIDVNSLVEYILQVGLIVFMLSFCIFDRIVFTYNSTTLKIESQICSSKKH